MNRRPPRSTRTDTLFPYTTLFRSSRQGIRGFHQGPAHHAGRRRHPLAERGPAPATGPLRLPAPHPVLQGRALAAERDRKSTRLTPVTNAHLVCRLLLEKKKK